MLLCFLKIGTPVAQVSFLYHVDELVLFLPLHTDCFSLLANMLGTGRKQSPPSCGTSRILHAPTKGPMTELPQYLLQFMETTAATKLPRVPAGQMGEQAWNEARKHPSSRQVSVTQDSKREDKKLTCKGFHFPAFQGGRRKRTKHEIRKHHGQRSGSVAALGKGAGSQEDLLKSAPWFHFKTETNQFCWRSHERIYSSTGEKGLLENVHATLSSHENVYIIKLNFCSR